MILSELAGQAMAVLSPLLLKGGESLTQSKGKDLWVSIKRLFKKENQQAVLEKFEKEPDNENTKEEVKVNLTAMLYAAKEKRRQIEKLVAAYLQENNAAVTANVKSLVTGERISGRTITFK